MHFPQQDILLRQSTYHNAKASRTRWVFPRAKSATPATQIERAESTDTNDITKRSFLTDAHFHSAMKIQATGKTDDDCFYYYKK